MTTRVLLACAYFDWFSNYQEIGIARALSASADVHVFAGDRANPIFTDQHLEKLGQSRFYPAGTKTENGITITRFKTSEARSMLFSNSYRKRATAEKFDLVIQVTPGFILPALASRPKGSAARAVLYGDNRAMYENLPPHLRKAKRVAFSASKGLVYKYCNRGASGIYCYTPDTIERISPFLENSEPHLFPLTFDNDTFFYSESLRDSERARMGFGPNDTIVVTAGKAYHTKRIDLLVAAFDKVADTEPSLRLVIAGMINGSGSETIQSAIDTAKNRDRIHSLPIQPTEALNKLFNAADIGCWPLMPAVTIQQAMGSGLPVVLPNNNIVGHLLRENGSGLYYDADYHDSNALARALSRSLALKLDSAHRKELAMRNSWLSSKHAADTLLELTLHNSR